MRYPRAGILHAAMFLLPLMSAVPSRAETYQGTLRLSNQVPIPGAAVLLTEAGVMVASATTDSSGYYLIVHPAVVARCLVFESRPGWTWRIHGFTSPGETFCGANGFEANGVLSRIVQSKLEVVGGANGYVNPARGEVATVVATPDAAGLVRMQIFDRRGREIASSEVMVGGAVAPFIPLQALLTWNGRDRDGQIVPSGIYYAAVAGEKVSRRTTKIAIVRD